MRIALLHPGYGSEETRSPETSIRKLGVALVDRGHEVSVITSHRTAREVTTEDGMRIIRRWRPPRLRILRRYEDWVETAPGLLAELWRSDAEVLDAFHPLDAFVATAAEPYLRSRPVVFSLTGTPTREHLVDRRYRLEMTLRAVRRAAAVTVGAEAAIEPCRRYLLREPVPVLGGAAQMAAQYEALYESLRA